MEPTVGRWLPPPPPPPPPTHTHTHTHTHKGPVLVFKKTLELSVIWDAVALVWPHCNEVLFEAIKAVEDYKADPETLVKSFLMHYLSSIAFVLNSDDEIYGYNRGCLHRYPRIVIRTDPTDYQCSRYFRNSYAVRINPSRYNWYLKGYCHADFMSCCVDYDTLIESTGKCYWFYRDIT